MKLFTWWTTQVKHLQHTSVEDQLSFPLKPALRKGIKFLIEVWMGLYSTFSCRVTKSFSATMFCYFRSFACSRSCQVTLLPFHAPAITQQSQYVNQQFLVFKSALLQALALGDMTLQCIRTYTLWFSLAVVLGDLHFRLFSHFVKNVFLQCRCHQGVSILMDTLVTMGKK